MGRGIKGELSIENGLLLYLSSATMAVDSDREQLSAPVGSYYHYILRSITISDYQQIGRAR